MSSEAPHPPAHGGHEKKGNSALAKIPEYIVKKGWGAITWTAKNIRDMVMGTIGGTLKATAGTALGTLADTGSVIGDTLRGVEADIKKTVHEVEEARHIEKAGAVVGGIMETTGNAVANAMKWFGRVGRGAANRFMSGSADVFDAVTFHKFDKNKGSHVAKSHAGNNGGGHGTHAPAH